MSFGKFFKKKNIFLLFCMLFVSVFVAKFVFDKQNIRSAVIVEVPIEAFSDNGKLIDEKWINYLKRQKPLGIIFFPEHFKDRNVSIKIISEIKNILGKNTFFAVDEEGGMIQRIPWIDIPSAMDVAKKYTELKREKNIIHARQYVRNVYAPMFKEMKELGLNMNFAPNLDISFFNSALNKDYAKAVKYMSISRMPLEKISIQQMSSYNEAILFKSYLNEIKVRKLPTYEIQFESLWKNADVKAKQKMQQNFDKIKQYANYAAVIGSRSFGHDPKIIAEVASIFMDVANEYDIKYVVKHALGHGRAIGDTHQGQQIVNASKEELLDHDMMPYRLLANKIKFVMPSHIVYSVIDDKPATVSKTVLDFFKENVSKDVVFISDDMSMAGADGIAESTCDILIISHKSVDEINQMHIKKIDIAKVDWI